MGPFKNLYQGKKQKSEEVFYFVSDENYMYKKRQYLTYIKYLTLKIQSIDFIFGNSYNTKYEKQICYK